MPFAKWPNLNADGRVGVGAIEEVGDGVVAGVIVGSGTNVTAGALRGGTEDGLRLELETIVEFESGCRLGAGVGAVVGKGVRA